MMSSEERSGMMEVPSILLSEATSDGEEATEDYGRLERSKKFEAVLTDVEASSDEDEPPPRPLTPVPDLGSSEAQVCETIYDPTRSIPLPTEVLTDVENFNTSGEEEDDEDNKPRQAFDITLAEGFDVSIADKVKTRCRRAARKPEKHRHSDPSVEYIDDIIKRNYLTPDNKLIKKKKKKNRLLLESCLTDTEDVDFASDVDVDIKIKKTFSPLCNSRLEEAEKTYQTRIKNKLKADQCSLLEFLTNKMEEGMLTDTDDIAYSDYECDDDTLLDTNYELDFANETKDKETVEKLRRNSPSESGVRIELSGSDDDSYQSTGSVKQFRGAEHVANERTPTLLYTDEPVGGITDVEDVDTSEEEGPPPRPCPTPELLAWEDSTTVQNEAVKEVKDTLAVIADMDPLTDSEDIIIRSPQLRYRKKSSKLSSARSGWDTNDEVLLSDNEGAGMIETESGGDTDVENFSDVDIEDFVPLTVTPDVLTHDSFVRGVEGSGEYLAAAKAKPSPIRIPLLRTTTPSPCPTDTEDFAASADEEPYPRPHTPADLQLDDTSSIVLVKNTRTFVTDGEESLYVKGADLQEPLTDVEDMADPPTRS